MTEVSEKTVHNNMFYNWRRVDGYNCPVTVVWGPRGIGKTFGKVLEAMREVVDKGYRFVYVVETFEDVKTLSANKGERFFSAIKEHLENGESKRKQKYFKRLFQNQSEIESGETDLIDDDNHKIMGGTIKINNETAGYLIALNSYGNLKRNNFVGIHMIIIDEFIPEEIDIRHLKIARKVASVIQTVARRHDVKIYMLGNSIRLDDILLVKLKLTNMKPGEIRVIKDKYGPLVVGHYVDKNEYPEFMKASESSVAGRLAALLGEDNLDKNEFKGELKDSLLIPDKPKSSHLLFCLHGQNDSVRINVTKDHSEYYVLSDYGKNARDRICFDQKYISDVVQYRPEWKEVLIQKYASGEIKFESSVIFMMFKNLLKLDINS